MQAGQRNVYVGDARYERGAALGPDLHPRLITINASVLLGPCRDNSFMLMTCVHTVACHSLLACVFF